MFVSSIKESCHADYKTYEVAPPKKNEVANTFFKNASKSTYKTNDTSITTFEDLITRMNAEGDLAHLNPKAHPKIFRFANDAHRILSAGGQLDVVVDLILLFCPRNQDPFVFRSLSQKTQPGAVGQEQADA